MKVVSSLKSHKKRDLNSKLVRRRGRIYIINKKNPKYKLLLASLYGSKKLDFNIRHAIASYIRKLSPFNSKFDNNINKKENTLTNQEKKGFNFSTYNVNYVFLLLG